METKSQDLKEPERRKDHEEKTEDLKNVKGSIGGIIGQTLARHIPQVTPHLRPLRLKAERKTSGVLANLSEYRHLLGRGLLWLCIVYDVYRVAAAVLRDLKQKGKPGKDCAKKTVSIGSSWALSTVGEIAGAWIGGSLGSIFGGFGSIPGATAGSVVGGLAGGLIGSFVGSTAGATAVEWLAPPKEKIKKTQ